MGEGGRSSSSSSSSSASAGGSGGVKQEGSGQAAATAAAANAAAAAAANAQMPLLTPSAPLRPAELGTLLELFARALPTLAGFTVFYRPGVTPLPARVDAMLCAAAQQALAQGFYAGALSKPVKPDVYAGVLGLLGSLVNDEVPCVMRRD